MPLTISGLTISRTDSSKLSIAQGSARDTTDSVTITIPNGQTRTVDLGTTGMGGLDTGTVQANKSYAVFVCQGSDGTVSGLASLSPTAPTVGSGTKFRRVGSIATGATGDIRDFTQTASGATRTTTWEIAPAVVSGGASINWALFGMAPWCPGWAASASLRVAMVSVGTTVAEDGGGNSSHFDPPGPEVKIIAPLDNDKGQYKNDSGGGSTTIRVVSFQEEV